MLKVTTAATITSQWLEYSLKLCFGDACHETREMHENLAFIYSNDILFRFIIN